MRGPSVDPVVDAVLGRSPHPARRCFGLLIAAATLFAAPLDLAAQPAAAPPALVVATPVLERSLSPDRDFSGTSEGSRHTVVGSAVAGRVLTIFAREGDEVRVSESGEAPQLAVLKTETIRQELASAKSELDYRQQLLDELRSSLPQDLNQFRAELQSANETLALAQSKFDTASALFQRQQATTREAFDEATANLAVAKQQQLVAQAALQRLEATGQIRIAQAESRVEAQEAEVTKLEDQLGKHTLRSPFDGVVVRQLAEEGDWLAQGQAIAEVTALDPLQIRVHVPETFVPMLQKMVRTAEGDGAEAAVIVTFDAIPDRIYTGTVHRIVLQADARSRSFPVLIRVENPPLPDGRRLGAGMLARVGLPVGDPEPQLLVPKDALRLGGPSPSVIVVDQTEQGTVAKLVPVELGMSDGPFVAVRGELSPEMLIVTEGHERLRPGQPLKVASIRRFDDVEAAPISGGPTTDAAALRSAGSSDGNVER